MLASPAADVSSEPENSMLPSLSIMVIFSVVLLPSIVAVALARYAALSSVKASGSFNLRKILAEDSSFLDKSVPSFVGI